jgi:hypothetical protein
MAYGWGRTHLGVLLTDGIAEGDVAAVVDLYPRTHTNAITGVSVEAPIVTTLHGLHLVARDRLDDAADLDRLIVPDGQGADAGGWPRDWAVPTLELRSDGETFLIDAVVRDIARQDSRASAALVTRGIEYPMETADLPGAAFPYGLLLRPLLLGLLGLGLLAGFRAGRRQHTGRS